MAESVARPRQSGRVRYQSLGMAQGSECMLSASAIASTINPAQRSSVPTSERSGAAVMWVDAGREGKGNVVGSFDHTDRTPLR